jgi:caa(3)-type oxidase subunit IV
MAVEHAVSQHSIRTYVLTYVVLLVLATASWVIASFHVPGAVVLGLGIGAIKAVLVLAYFMHLSDEPFSFKLVLMTAIVLVAIFIGLTALDPLTRYHAS